MVCPTSPPRTGRAYRADWALADGQVRGRGVVGASVWVRMATGACVVRPADREGPLGRQPHRAPHHHVDPRGAEGVPAEGVPVRHRRRPGDARVLDRHRGGGDQPVLVHVRGLPPVPHLDGHPAGPPQGRGPRHQRQPGGAVRPAPAPGSWRARTVSASSRRCSSCSWRSGARTCSSRSTRSPRSSGSRRTRTSSSRRTPSPCSACGRCTSCWPGCWNGSSTAPSGWRSSWCSSASSSSSVPPRGRGRGDPARADVAVAGVIIGVLVVTTIASLVRSRSHPEQKADSGWLRGHHDRERVHHRR